MGPDIDTTISSQHRPSIRVTKAAKILEVDISTIYRMVRAGTLEAHRIGKRGVRIFSDSLRTYQEQGKIVSQNEYTTPNQTQRNKAKPINSHAHQDAISYLRSIGCL